MTFAGLSAKVYVVLSLASKKEEPPKRNLQTKRENHIGFVMSKVR